MCELVNLHSSDKVYCRSYHNLPLASTNCSDQSEVVPRILHAVSGSHVPPIPIRIAALANPSYKLAYHNDTSAAAFVRAHCGENVARAYACFRPPAYRADLFRFCALYARGGVYLDSDLHLMAPLNTLYRPCTNLSVGHDWPKGAAQMKILAARPGHPVMRCMLRRIQEHVAWRYIPSSSLLISGPELLGQCVKSDGGRDVAFTHLDTRAAAWPYTGLRSRDRLFAFEEPNIKRHWGKGDKDDYDSMFKSKSVYTDTCAIAPEPLPFAIAAQDKRARNKIKREALKTEKQNLYFNKYMHALLESAKKDNYNGLKKHVSSQRGLAYKRHIARAAAVPAKPTNHHDPHISW